MSLGAVCGPVHEGDAVTDTLRGRVGPVQVGGVYNLTQPTYDTGDTARAQFSARGELLVATGTSGMAAPGGTPTSTTPSIATATSVTIAAANAARKYLLVQNNSAANIMISLSGATLTGIVPSATNIGLVLTPGDSYESPASYITRSAITAYQTSGGTINTVVVVEG